MEEWKKMIGFEDRYEISSLGKIKNLLKNKISIGTPNSRGYYCILLRKPGIKYKSFTIHRLVCTHYLPNPNNYEQINHIDGDKSNNKKDNLEWCTRSQNMRHAMNVLGFKPSGFLGHFGNPGEDNYNAKLTEDDVRNIYELCKTTKSKEVAIRYNMTRESINNIKSGRSWKHIFNNAVDLAT